MIFFFLIHPQEAFLASLSGLTLWFRQVLPTLLPFSILSNLLVSSHLFEEIERKFKKNKPQKYPLSFPEVFIIFCGFLFGFPIGSKLTADMYERNLISKSRAQTLLCFTNNLSPVFLCTFVCQNQLHLPQLTSLLLFVVFFPPFTLGLAQLLSGSGQPVNAQKKAASRFCINMKIIDAGILCSFETLIKLCGYIVIFSINANMLALCDRLPATIRCLLTGTLEVTTGIYTLADINFSDERKLLLSVFLLSFGGLSGIAQTNSVINENDLSIKNYCIQKIIYSFVSCTLLILYLLFVGI